MASILPVTQPLSRALRLAIASLFAAALLGSITSVGAAPSSVVKTAVAKTSPPRIPTAAALYQRSLDADDQFSYRGRQITTYWRSGRATAVIVSHRAPTLRRLDYLAPDAQRGRAWVTDETQEWQYDPQKKQLLHRRLAPNADAVADAAARYDLLRTNYILQVVPQVKTWADRKAYLVTLTRKADRTPARRLWVDAATGLVLKRESFREDGTLALTVAFSDINFHVPLPRAVFDLSALAARPGVQRVEEKPAAETTLPLASVGGQLGGKAIAPGSLAGYQLVSAALAGNGSRPLLHLRYSDGLNLVSLFEQPRTQMRRPTRVPSAMKPVQIGTRTGHVTRRASLTAFNWDRGPLNLTLMGEIAEPSLHALAQAAEVCGP